MMRSGRYGVLNKSHFSFDKSPKSSNNGSIETNLCAHIGNDNKREKSFLQVIDVPTHTLPLLASSTIDLHFSMKSSGLFVSII